MTSENKMHYKFSSESFVSCSELAIRLMWFKGSILNKKSVFEPWQLCPGLK